MRRQLSLLAVGVAVLVLPWSLGAQSQAGGTVTKRPLWYDVMDYWRSIARHVACRTTGSGWRMALTSQGDDLLISWCRNLEERPGISSAARERTTFTNDGKFVMFTIARAEVG